ncbi:MAG: FtsL-like putative cell division protein [Muribaculaceae bacterium]|nr:FtsL-like putative cell division protein [Bacteroidales bacterium]MDD6722894.1 FtsL-like putative cell division protein [Bacteroidales bacterium]
MNPLVKAWKYTDTLRQGGTIRVDFFLRYWLQLLILLVLVMVFITSKYQRMTKMEEIRRLENELMIMRTERVRERSTYMSRIRESAMQRLADSIRPGLTVQEQPPYELNAKP